LFQDLLFFLEHQILEEVHRTFDLVKHVEEKLVVMSSFALLHVKVLNELVVQVVYEDLDSLQTRYVLGEILISL
jgi:hypothetical protein